MHHLHTTRECREHISLCSRVLLVTPNLSGASGAELLQGAGGLSGQGPPDLDSVDTCRDMHDREAERKEKERFADPALREAAPRCLDELCMFSWSQFARGPACICLCASFHTFRPAAFLRIREPRRSAVRRVHGMSAYAVLVSSLPCLVA